MNVSLEDKKEEEVEKKSKKKDKVKKDVHIKGEFKQISLNITKEWEFKGIYYVNAENRV